MVRTDVLQSNEYIIHDNDVTDGKDNRTPVHLYLFVAFSTHVIVQKAQESVYGGVMKAVDNTAADVKDRRSRLTISLNQSNL